MNRIFENKVVLITGATSGIGRETALAFAREGARVTVAGRREAEGAQVVQELQRSGPRRFSSGQTSPAKLTRKRWWRRRCSALGAGPIIGTDDDVF